MTRRLGLLSSAVLFFLTTPGQGQDRTTPLPLAEPIRIHLNITYFVPGAMTEGPDSEKSRAARRAIYELSTRECDFLKDIFAKDCRVESLNVNISRQYGSQQQEGFNATGNIVMRVTPK